MKSILSWLIFLLCLFAACQKNTAVNGNGGNNNNGGGGSNNKSDTISVTSYSPANPYTSDVVTITGTGFNPDKTKDSVWFRDDDGSGYFKIVSATSTQLQILLPPDSISQILTVNSDGVLDLKISANGKFKAIPKAIKFKMTLSLQGVWSPRLGDPTRPGDSTYLFGRGFTWNSTSISINGQTMPILKLDSGGANPYGEYSNRWFAYTYLPKSFFGEVNNEDSVKYLPCSVTNGDGKTAVAMLPFGISPLMAITDMHYDNEYLAGGGVRTISLSAASGAVLRLHVIGKNLKNNVDVAFTGTDGTNAHSGLPVSGFPDSTIVEFGTSNIKPGYTYIVTFWANNSSKGNVSYGSHTIFVAN
ncbi:MAG: hypothetical protein BGO55_06420 [Sphingobacteriales bacterium 50-39]|nr:IPT/TIG domain-containing protein [Sphingobacteriales bacterium]OJW52893.1 MAG: hypothetical protein BGO55_06420 [Sphingobacteriales bacterium 50-39]